MHKGLSGKARRQPGGAARFDGRGRCEPRCGAARRPGGRLAVARAAPFFLSGTEASEPEVGMGQAWDRHCPFLLSGTEASEPDVQLVQAPMGQALPLSFCRVPRQASPTCNLCRHLWDRHRPFLLSGTEASEPEVGIRERRRSRPPLPLRAPRRRAVKLPAPATHRRARTPRFGPPPGCAGVRMARHASGARP